MTILAFYNIIMIIVVVALFFWDTCASMFSRHPLSCTEAHKRSPRRCDSPPKIWTVLRKDCEIREERLPKIKKANPHPQSTSMYRNKKCTSAVRHLKWAFNNPCKGHVFSVQEFHWKSPMATKSNNNSKEYKHRHKREVSSHRSSSLLWLFQLLWISLQNYFDQ